ncbi:MAG: glycosyltransferase [Bacteroidales bacterium]|nr:glycosyltransferase [Bacteroidales bacterium]
MKILFLAKIDYSGLTEGMSRAFRKKNFSTQIFDTKRYRKIDKYFKRDFSFQKFEKKLKEFCPDTIFLIAPMFLKREYFEIIDKFKEKNKLKVVGWVGDSFKKEKENIEKLSLIDRLYYTDTGFFDIYSADNVEYLPLATDPKIFIEKGFIYKNKYNCSFVASRTPGRASFLKELKCCVDVFGPGWNNNGIQGKAHNFKSTKLHISKVSNIYARSRMVLNLKNENNVINGLNQRSFDPCAAGSLLLHDYVADIDLNYEVGKEILVFRSEEEFSELYKKCMIDSEFRRKISENGRKRVASCHTFTDRVEKVLSGLG